MRKVYQHEKKPAGFFLALALSALLAGAVFGFLPFAHGLATPRSAVELRKVSATDLAPPPEEEAPPPPEAEEEAAPELEPSVDEAPMPLMSLGQLDLALEGGGGGTGAAIADFGLGTQTASNLVAAIDVFELSEVDKAPAPTMQMPPRYPSDMQRDKVEGTVVLVFVLDERGRVKEARAETSTHPSFERPAIDAVRQWMFEPAVKDGKPVRARIRQPIRFRLNS